MPNSFTPEQIAEILEEFFNTVGTRQYIGARYVPIFGRKGEESIEWDNTGTYEPLSIVLYQGNSYTSRQFVPVGVEITNQEFWAITGNYNAQIEQYRRDTAAARAAADAAQADIDTLLPKASFDAENTVKAYIDAKNADTRAYVDASTLLNTGVVFMSDYETLQDAIDAADGKRLFVDVDELTGDANIRDANITIDFGGRKVTSKGLSLDIFDSNVRIQNGSIDFTSTDTMRIEGHWRNNADFKSNLCISGITFGTSHSNAFVLTLSDIAGVKVERCTFAPNDLTTTRKENLSLSGIFLKVCANVFISNNTFFNLLYGVFSRSEETAYAEGVFITGNEFLFLNTAIMVAEQLTQFRRCFYWDVSNNMIDQLIDAAVSAYAIRALNISKNYVGFSLGQANSGCACIKLVSPPDHYTEGVTSDHNYFYGITNATHAHGISFEGESSFIYSGDGDNFNACDYAAYKTEAGASLVGCIQNATIFGTTLAENIKRMIFFANCYMQGTNGAQVYGTNNDNALSYASQIGTVTLNDTSDVVYQNRTRAHAMVLIKTKDRNNNNIVVNYQTQDQATIHCLQCQADGKEYTFELPSGYGAIFGVANGCTTVNIDSIRVIGMTRS